ncbi:hypothetical protein B0H13DRAFT_1857453 [Mycena leptocephala]|nr:hypothetical protein B0H13DRAFT_1857453 [Mycena leptocephala]
MPLRGRSRGTRAAPSRRGGWGYGVSVSFRLWSLGGEGGLMSFWSRGSEKAKGGVAKLGGRKGRESEQVGHTKRRTKTTHHSPRALDAKLDAERARGERAEHVGGDPQRDEDRGEAGECVRRGVSVEGEEREDGTGGSTRARNEERGPLGKKRHVSLSWRPTAPTRQIDATTSASHGRGTLPPSTSPPPAKRSKPSAPRALKRRKGREGFGAKEGKGNVTENSSSKEVRSRKNKNRK